MESTSHRYQWTEEERRLLRESGLVLTPTRRLNFEGRVWHGTLDGKAYVVRAIPQQEGSQEVIALKTLLSQPNNPRNHTVPAKIHSGPNAHLLIMPFFTPVDIFISTTPPLHILLKMIRQIIEGVTYMHELHIAHVDVAIPNIVVPDSMLAGTPPLIYFIDFGSSRALDAPPEHMHALERYHEFAGHFELPESPDGPVIMNPYEYDVYSVGWTIATIVAFYPHYHYYRPIRRGGTSPRALQTSAPAFKPSAFHVPP
ncbi:hypothetical protein OF83DRAFT_1120522 [Amylostereum chailletii]|nr:hypothetical protein OF83DRAFT_1120522 [Amylostereum chailletii]